MNLPDVTIRVRQDGKETRVLVEVDGEQPTASAQRNLASALGWACAEALLLTGEVPAADAPRPTDPLARWVSQVRKTPLVHVTAPAEAWPDGRSGVSAFCGTSARPTPKGPRRALRPDEPTPPGARDCWRCGALASAWKDGKRP